MSDIRKNSLKATAWIYIGFLFGAVNTYFLTHRDWFTPDQNGLTRSLIDISLLIYAFSSLGTSNLMVKFFPYYQDNLKPSENDLLSLAFRISLIGFTLTALGIWLMNPLIVKKFGTNSILLVDYIYWTLPMGFFALQFYLLEYYAYGFGKGVLSSLLRETILRFYVLIVITLKIMGWIDFKTFILLFSLQYAIITLALAAHLWKNGQLWISFTTSRVTRKFRKKITAMLAFTFLVVIVTFLRQSIDGLVLAAKQNLGKVGIFGLASYMVSILQAPFRSLVAVTVPKLSRAWKAKNLPEIQRIYERSSINMLAFSLGIFFCVWMNFERGIELLHIHPSYLEGKWVFFLLGMVTIIELGTGVNGQIIGTSTHWRVELWTSLLLTLMIIPLSYTLTNKYGLIGPAYANLVSFSVYNFIRYYFLWKKFNLQPFTFKTLELLFMATATYFLVDVCFSGMEESWFGLLGSCAMYGLIYAGWIYKRKLSPDVHQLLEVVEKRFRKK